MENLVEYDVEYTDTFGGDANYSWVKRAVVSVPESASDAMLMRRAKAAMGISGMRGTKSGDSWFAEFRPYGVAAVMFITFRD